MDIKTYMKFEVIGFCGANPQLEVIPKSGDFVTSLSIAVGSDQYTEWVNLAFFGKAAEMIVTGNFKGMLMKAVGKPFDVHKYQTKDGKKKVDYKMYVNQLYYSNKGDSEWTEIKLPAKDENKNGSVGGSPFGKQETQDEQEGGIDWQKKQDEMQQNKGNGHKKDKIPV